MIAFHEDELRKLSEAAEVEEKPLQFAALMERIAWKRQRVLGLKEQLARCDHAKRPTKWPKKAHEEGLD